MWHVCVASPYDILTLLISVPLLIPFNTLAQFTHGNVIKPFLAFKAFMDSKDYKEPENGGQYGAKHLKMIRQLSLDDE